VLAVEGLSSTRSSHIGLTCGFRLSIFSCDRKTTATYPFTRASISGLPPGAASLGFLSMTSCMTSSKLTSARALLSRLTLARGRIWQPRPASAATRRYFRDKLSHIAFPEEVVGSPRCRRRKAIGNDVNFWISGIISEVWKSDKPYRPLLSPLMPGKGRKSLCVNVCG